VSGTATVTVVSANANNVQVTATCAAGQHAVGGGGFSTGGQNIDLTASFPSNSTGTPTASGTNPTSWTARFASATGSNTAYVLCTP
jgi:hypothetical protein